MIFSSVWYFAKTINSFVPFPLSFHFLSWILATMRSFYSFTTNPLEPLWLTSNWKIIFTTAALLCGMVFRENLSSPSYYPGLASFPFTLWIHLCLSGDDIWFSLLWCGDDISLGKGKRMKCLHLSIYIFPPFSISIFPSPSSYPSTSHLPSPSFQLFVEDSPSFIQWRFLQDPFQWK